MQRFDGPNYGFIWLQSVLKRLRAGAVRERNFGIRE